MDFDSLRAELPKESSIDNCAYHGLAMAICGFRKVMFPKGPTNISNVGPPPDGDPPRITM